ncbi:MAG: type II toxin-antitoxin system HipA family toxin [Solirubrobacteraceae bacterium]
MTDRRLDVWCFDEHAGTLVDAQEGLAFSYAETWTSAARPPLSQSLPLSGEFGGSAVSAYFGGLLPEGQPRDVLARHLGVSRGNDFGLLERLGGDMAGAVSLLTPGAGPARRGADVEWLSEEEVATVIQELAMRPMHADADGEFRLSLAGVQDKLPVIADDDGRIGLTKGGTPSTHILKAPIPRLDDTVANEALCLALGRLLGVHAVTATPRRAGQVEFLLVERYDRRHDGDRIRRLHQEDFCQALAIPSSRKYQNEGGPSLVDCFDLLRRAAAVPARETPRLLDFVALSFLVGNHDAHGKNYSLLYSQQASRAALAPAYDVLSTIAYEKLRPMSRKMAMSIGREYRPDYLRPRHLDALLADAQLGPAAARRRLRALARDAPGAVRDARADLLSQGWDPAVASRIVEVVDRRAGRLADVAASLPRSGR